MSAQKNIEATPTADGTISAEDHANALRNADERWRRVCAAILVERDAVRDAARSMSDADGYPNDGSGPVAYMHKLRAMVAMLTSRAREDDRALATEKARADKLEADCAALRGHVLSLSQSMPPPVSGDYADDECEDAAIDARDMVSAWFRNQLKQIAATSAGTGWVSPEDHARALREQPCCGSASCGRVQAAEAQRDAALAAKAQLLGALEAARPAIRANAYFRVEDALALALADAAIAAAKGGAT